MREKIKQLIVPLLFALLPVIIFAQGTAKKDEPRIWHLLDKTESGYFGISLDKAYEFVKGKKSKQVIVAVIDSGIDTLQEDLKDVLWHNPGEIPGNGIDDDQNGYVDDIYGWNFLGGKDGRSVHEDSYEAARIYHRLKAKYGDVVPDPSTVKPGDRAEVETYRKAKEKVESWGKGLDLVLFRRIYNTMHKSDSILQIAMGVKVFTGKEVGAFTPTTLEAEKAKNTFYGFLKANNTLDQTNKDFMTDFDDYLKGEEKKG